VTKTNKVKKHNHARNRNVRERLMAQGYTEEQARAIIIADGMKANQLHNQQVNEVRRAHQERDEKLYPRQPLEPHSVQAIPVAFEANRSRH
jgi:nitrate reductase cytochrome c-type subunit